MLTSFCHGAESTYLPVVNPAWEMTIMAATSVEQPLVCLRMHPGIAESNTHFIEDSPPLSFAIERR